MEPVMSSDTREHYSPVRLGDWSVTPSVEVMSYHRTAYDDASTATEMKSDCGEVDRTLQLGQQRRGGTPPHSIQDGRYETVTVSDDLAQLAAGLELHFD
jgi:hypothetical protein